MAAPSLNTPDAVGPIRDINARRVCGLSGIATAQRKLVSFRQLRDALNISIRELENEHRKEQRINRVFLVVRFTKATCDAFLGMAAGLSKVILPKRAAAAADLVNKVYTTATPLAEAAGTLAAGGKVDLVKTAATTLKEGASFITDNEGYAIVIKSTAVKAEVINSAINGDKEGAMKTAASYVYDLHTSLGDMAGHKKVAVFAEMAKQAFEYNEQIGKAFDEILESSLESDEQYRTLKTVISNQARLLSTKIDALEKFIQSCEQDQN